ncbi:hypothetical protein ACLHIJ_00310 [Trueperella sp. LYQ141]
MRGHSAPILIDGSPARQPEHCPKVTRKGGVCIAAGGKAAAQMNDY